MSGYPIRVGVVFGPGRQIRPVWFERNGEKAHIDQLCLHWKSEGCNGLRDHFSVRTGDDLAELVFDRNLSVWRLQGQSAGGG